MPTDTRSRNSKVVGRCEWCWNECDLNAMQIPQSPILEWIEEKLEGVDRSLVPPKLSKQEEYEIVLYDYMISNLRFGRVCSKCWDKEQQLWDKYYENEDE